MCAPTGPAYIKGVEALQNFGTAIEKIAIPVQLIATAPRRGGSRRSKYPAWS
jgi:hypothetical protein